MDADSVWASNKERLPPGFYEKTVYRAPYQISADVDQDGDLDLIGARGLPGLSYLENIGSARHPVFVNPYNPFPFDQVFGDNDSSVLGSIPYWIQLTDFDTDGDIDLLTELNGRLNFFEKLNGRPLQYSSPNSIDTQLSPSQWDDFGGFADLDGDGVQEFLILYLGGKLILQTKLEDGSFEQILLHQGDELQPGFVRGNTLQFVDGDNDGDLDVAMRSRPDDVEKIYYFEQQAPLAFAPLKILPQYALDLQETRFDSFPKSADLDGDGDNDKVYKFGYVEWNHEREPGSIVNFSIRSNVGESADVQIGGFIIEGGSPQTVILRGLGPSLAGKGVSDPLNDPEIHLFSGQTKIAGNDDWQSTEGADKIESAGIAPTDPREAALRVRLNPGAYTVHLKGDAGDTGVGIIGIDPDILMPTTSLQINISGRVLVEDGENVTIGGFIIEGDTPVKVLIRGLGPSLQEKGVDSPLADPTISLFSDSAVIARNNDWKQNSNTAEIAALETAPTDDKEAAILTVLQPGRYTVHLRDAKGDSGIGIVAIDRP